MKKKHAIKAALLFTLILCIFAQSISAFAAMPPKSEPNYVGTRSVRSFLDVSSGTATCTGVVSLKSGYTCSLLMKLESSTDGVTWSTYASWTTTGVDLLQSCSISSGRYYRTTVSARVYNSSGSYVETASGESGAIYY